MLGRVLWNICICVCKKQKLSFALSKILCPKLSVIVFASARSKRKRKRKNDSMQQVVHHTVFIYFLWQFLIITKYTISLVTTILCKNKEAIPVD
jgi:hypothetical protein